MNVLKMESYASMLCVLETCTFHQVGKNDIFMMLPLVNYKNVMWGCKIQEHKNLIHKSFSNSQVGKKSMSLKYTKNIYDSMHLTNNIANTCSLYLFVYI